jgi:peroxiredoxin
MRMMIKRLLPWMLGFAFTLAMAAGPLAGETLEPAKPGDPLPSVQVRNDAGLAVDLRAMALGQPSVIVFYRGGWCPYCTAHLAELGQREASLRERGFRIFAVSPDRPEKLRESIAKLRALADKEAPSYSLLSDSQMKAAQAFGIAFEVERELVRVYREKHGIDLEDAAGETHHLLPHPALFIASADGVIRFAHVDTDYRKRLSGPEIMAAAEEAIKPASAHR